MNENVIPHVRPDNIYGKTVNKIDGISEINPYLGFNFKDKEYNSLKNDAYESEFMVSYEIEKNPTNVIMKMYDYDYKFASYDWIIWLLNDINNPLKELIEGKVLRKYPQEVLERIIVRFKNARK